VTTPKEYREYADECPGWAKSAKSDREREIFLQMAQTWLEAANLAEAKQTLSAGIKLHRQAGVKIHYGGCRIGLGG
jgi:hypothetical protein